MDKNGWASALLILSCFWIVRTSESNNLSFTSIEPNDTSAHYDGATTVGFVEDLQDIYFDYITLFNIECWLYITPILLILGTAGNALILLVLKR